MQTKALKCGSTEFKHQIRTSPMYRMSQLIGGRKKQKSKMEAAWGTLDGTPPSSSSKKPTGKIPLPNSAASTSIERPWNNSPRSSSGPVVCLGHGQLPTTVAMDIWDLAVGWGVKEREA